MTELLTSLIQWSHNLGALGAIVFIGLYAIATVFAVPGTILTVGAGAVFGWGWGSAYAWVGATLGAILAFVAGRYAVRGWVAKQMEDHPKFSAIDRAIGQAGFKIVLLLRLSPVFPFTLLNYALSLTSVSLRDYALASIGMLPATITYVYLGSLAGNLAGAAGMTQEAQTIQWIIRMIGLAATVAVTVYVTKIAKRALSQAIELVE